MWDTRYRPLKFADVLGQQGTVKVLQARLRNGTALDTSYIFSGGSGQGKTTLARIFARAIICENLDRDSPEPCNECDNCKAILDGNSVIFTERDAASQGTIDHMRAIVEELPYAVFGAAKRLYLFDEVHRMSKDSQDVLLKPIEDKKLVAFFCTTEPEKIRGAIRGRCEEHQIRKVTAEDILERMKLVLQQEDVSYEPDAVRIVIDYCGGHVRDVLMKLETIAQMGPITEENVRSALNLSLVSSYYEILCLLQADTSGALALLDKISNRVTPEEISSGLAEAAMNSFRLANKMTSDFTFVDKSLGAKVYSLYGSETVKIAEYFLRSRYPSYVGLVCDLLSMAQSFGTMRVAPAVPVVRPAPLKVTVLEADPSVTAGGGPPQAEVAKPAQEAVALKPQEAAAPKPQEMAAPKPQETKTQKAAPPAVDRRGLRVDGVGNYGSSDPEALTDLDTLVVPVSTQQVRVVELEMKRERGGRERLTPKEWRTEFEMAYTRGVRSGS